MSVRVKDSLMLLVLVGKNSIRWKLVGNKYKQKTLNY